MVAEVIFSRDGSGDHVRPLLPGCLPPAVFGIPIEQVPLPLLKRRNLLLYLLAAEAIVSFLCLGVGAHRSGVCVCVQRRHRWAACMCACPLSCLTAPWPLLPPLQGSRAYPSD